jgi:hypothetical protein
LDFFSRAWELEDSANYDKALNLQEKGYATVAACAAGYRAEDDKYAELAKVRFKSLK